MVKIDLLKDGKVERTSFCSNITRAVKEKDHLLNYQLILYVINTIGKSDSLAVMGKKHSTNEQKNNYDIQRSFPEL